MSALSSAWEERPLRVWVELCQWDAIWRATSPVQRNLRGSLASVRPCTQPARAAWDGPRTITSFDRLVTVGHATCDLAFCLFPMAAKILGLAGRTQSKFWLHGPHSVGAVVDGLCPRCG